MSDIVIAIDGPAGAGKSTVARALAHRMKLPHIDTGAMYRALALKALREGADLGDGEALGLLAAASSIRLIGDRCLLDGEEVTAEIRLNEVTAAASVVASHPQVRRRLVALQRAAVVGGAVVEGRDIGTVVLPAADVKVFLTASEDERALRRSRDLAAAGTAQSFHDVKTSILKRDRSDSGRAESPLVVAHDAVVIDSTGREVDEIVEEIIKTAKGARS